MSETIKLDDGRQWIRRGDGYEPILDDAFVVLNLSTLSGVVRWLTAEGAPNAMIHVNSHKSVSVIGNLGGPRKQRNTYVICDMIRRHEFNFGSYMSPEEFIIGLECLFADTPAKKKLMEFISNVRGEHLETIADDGISQLVSVQDKVGARLTTEEVDPVVQLAPYRTFNEINQPISNFMLRLAKSSGRTLPNIALFEADGGAWKNKAIEDIRKYFTEDETIKKLNTPVIA